jgi:hypothetical protein
MPGFFEALENFKPKEKKPHVVTIEGQSIVVSLERKLEIMQAGEDVYTWKNGEVVKKKRIPVEQRQPLMHKADKGYTFYKKNPFWVKNIDKEGYIWQIK